MKFQSFEFFRQTSKTGTDGRKESTTPWIAVAAAIGLTAGMFFVQSCSASAKAGPNGGDVIALNDGKTTAEVLANAETGEVMVHTWGNDLKSTRPLEATPLTIGADEKQIQLEPRPLPSDPAGYCSRFYGRADWLRGGSIRHGWLSHSGAKTEHRDFEWNRGWLAGKSHGPMWSEMQGHGPGMPRGGPGGMHRE
ncbi:MAG TPA: hypothetical protein VHO24_04540 [Opitutaceae bacterium]|nr:hypothetical protein [Opitutaceae bacterium]